MVNHPNFVIVIADDMPRDAFANACAQFIGRSDITNYTAAYAGPECDPMRATIFSGQHDFNHGVQDNTMDANFDHTHSFAYALQKVGYRTCLLGKYLENYQSKARPPHQPVGWSDFRGFIGIPTYYYFFLNENGTPVYYPKALPPDTGYETDLLTSKACDFIATATVPFLLTVGFHNPHEPALALAPHTNAFQAPQPTLPPSFGVVQSNAPAWINALPPIVQSTFINTRRAVWKASLSVQDSLLAILAQLDASGLLNDTVFIFCTDQGLSIGERNWISKRDIYQPTVNAPLAIRWPSLINRVDAPGTNTKLISFTDIAPTILGLAGVTADWQMDGQSILSPAPRRYAFMHWIGGGGNNADGANVPPTPGYRCVTNDSFKYSVLSTTGERELYDLINDPWELSNVIDNSDPRIVAAQNTLASVLDTFL
jgi:arylsulfatase A-like enzyme